MNFASIPSPVLNWLHPMKAPHYLNYPIRILGIKSITVSGLYHREHLKYAFGDRYFISPIVILAIVLTARMVPGKDNNIDNRCYTYTSYQKVLAPKLS